MSTGSLVGSAEVVAALVVDGPLLVVVSAATADVVVANLNGLSTDDGTAWELGYAYAAGKHLIGMHTDWRTRFPHEVVNLMIECSLHRMVRSLDELAAALAEHQRAHA